MSSSRLHATLDKLITDRDRIVSGKSAKLLAAAGVALALVPAAAVAQPAAPLVGSDRPGAVADRYIVVMKGAASDASKERTKDKARARGGRIARDYGLVLEGYAASLPARALAEVRADPGVAYVEADRVVSASATQSSAPWGLDRIDQGGLPLSGSYSYTPTGAGVKAYVIDTGIRFSHSEFGGRAVSGFDAIDGGSADDCDGHGTHVAGTVGASTYGVAKQVTLVGVRVLDCEGSGTTSGVIAGIDWVTRDHGAGQPAVANLSLGGDPSSALDTAVQNSIDDGVSYAVAAGNENVDACLSSPARAANALTVASTTSTDSRSWFSNFGSCVDLFAPGSSIVSSSFTSDSATATSSGTSMAAPHVAGAAALYLQDNAAATPATVAAAINDGATTGKVTDAGTGSPNRLLLAADSQTADTSAPDTSIDSAPPATMASSSPSLAFSSSEAASTFACKLDGPGSTTGSYASCSSPKGYTSLADGSYTFSVRATDAAGNTDVTAAVRTFTVDTVAPQTTIDSGPTAIAPSSSPSFAFSSSEAASRFACKLDGPGSTTAGYASCASPTSYTSLADGSYTFSVRATDAAGNADATDAIRTFTVESAQPAPTPEPAPAPAPAPEAAPPPAPAVTVLDTRAPVARVAARKLQRLGRNVRVSVSCPEETCIVSASGAVSVPKIGGAQARRFKLKKVSTAITKGATAKLGPRLSYAARRSIRRALARGRRITVKLTVTATDAAGNSRTLTRYVRLRR